MTPREEWGDGDRTDRQLEAPDAGPRFAGYSLLGLSILLYLVSCSYLSSEDTKIDVCRGALVGSPRKVWEARRMCSGSAASEEQESPDFQRANSRGSSVSEMAQRTRDEAHRSRSQSHAPVFLCQPKKQHTSKTQDRK